MITSTDTTPGKVLLNAHLFCLILIRHLCGTLDGDARRVKLVEGLQRQELLLAVGAYKLSFINPDSSERKKLSGYLNLLLDFLFT